MAINLAKKSCDKLVQAAALESSVLVGALSTAYNFVGAKTVEVCLAIVESSQTGEKVAPKLDF